MALGVEVGSMRRRTKLLLVMALWVGMKEKDLQSNAHKQCPVTLGASQEIGTA